jgi:hypothetical protein
MYFTLKIGLTYLWVDRYCIDQNNTEEKHDNIRNMEAICNLTFLLRYDSVYALGSIMLVRHPSLTVSSHPLNLGLKSRWPLAC